MVVGMKKIDDVLKPAAAGLLRQLLAAVWSGDSDFPETVDVAAQLSDEARGWLLELGERADMDLWDRVARRTDLSQLERVAPIEYSANFQRLVTASLDHLHAKAAHVRTREHRATDSDADDPPVLWGREGDVLALDIANYRILVGSTIEKVRRRTEQTEQKLPSVRELADRGLTLAVPKLKVDDKDFELQAVAKERTATETRSDLERAADSLDESSRVSNLEVIVPGGGRLAVDFRRALSTAVAASNPSLSEMVRVSALLLCEMTDELRELLSATLPPHSSRVPGQAELDLDGLN